MNNVVMIPFAGPTLAPRPRSAKGSTDKTRAAQPAGRNGTSKAASGASKAATLPLARVKTGRAWDEPLAVAGPSLPAFMAGPENRLASVALREVLQRGASVYSPLYFYGPAGCGKTHLAQGLVEWWENQPTAGGQRGAGTAQLGAGSAAVLLSGSEFVEQFAAAMEADRVDAWRNEYRTAALFVLEDLGELASKKHAQQELCQTLDALDAAGALVVITAHALPGQIPGLAPNLRSRLSAGLAVQMALPGAGARRIIVETVGAAQELPLTKAAACLLADSVAGNVPTLVDTLFELAESAADEPRLDVPQVQAFIGQRKAAQPPTLRAIATHTAKYFRLTLADLKSPQRRQGLVTARGVAFVLARQLTDKSLDQIGEYFGGRDHTTVLHACRRTEELAKDDPQLQQSITELKRLITLA